MENACDLSYRQYSVVEVSGVESRLKAPAGGQRCDLLKGRAVFFKLGDFDRKSVVQHTRRVGKAPQHQRRAHLVGMQGNCLLTGTQCGSFFREEKSRAYRRSLTAEHQCCRKSAPVAHSAAGDHGDIQCISSRGPEHH